MFLVTRTVNPDKSFQNAENGSCWKEVRNQGEKVG